MGKKKDIKANICSKKEGRITPKRQKKRKHKVKDANRTNRNIIDMDTNQLKNKHIKDVKIDNNKKDTYKEIYIRSKDTWDNRENYNKANNQNMKNKRKNAWLKKNDIKSLKHKINTRKRKTTRKGKVENTNNFHNKKKEK